MLLQNKGCLFSAQATVCAYNCRMGGSNVTCAEVTAIQSLLNIKGNVLCAGTAELTSINIFNQNLEQTEAAMHDVYRQHQGQIIPCSKTGGSD